MKNILFFAALLALALCATGCPSANGDAKRLCTIATQTVEARLRLPEPVDKGDLWALWPEIAGEFNRGGRSTDVHKIVTALHFIDADSRWVAFEAGLGEAGVKNFTCPALKDVLTDKP